MSPYETIYMYIGVCEMENVRMFMLGRLASKNFHFLSKLVRFSDLFPVPIVYCEIEDHWR